MAQSDASPTGDAAVHARMLTADELARLATATVDPADWGESLCVVFEARRLTTARVCWLNKRWFVEQGVDVLDPGVRERVGRWLLQEFGYVVPRTEDPPESFGSESAKFLADRYGGTGLVPHGGSGRAGIRNGFQVKGIGITPLVGKDADWLHSHGCVWLEEAFREAIFAELFAAEAPCGAIPTIAILDTDLHMMHDGLAGERRALVIRPFVPRPAHLQRAPWFRPIDGDPHAQPLDADRTREAIAAYRRYAGGGVALAPTELFHCLGRQAAFSHLNRLSHGGFFSSNLTLHGALIDFGSATAWPNWDRHCVASNPPIFGDEALYVAQMAHSLSFYLGKYADDDAVGATAMLDAFRDGYRAGAIDEAARVWALDGNDRAAQAIADVLIAAFARQQRGGVQASAPTPIMLAVEEHEAIELALGPDATRRFRSWRNALRSLQPRPHADRERLQAWLFDWLVRRERAGPLMPDDVDAAVTQLLSAVRRMWEDLPADLEVLAQVNDGCSSALACRHDDGTRCVWLQGPKLDDRVLLFDRWYAIDDLAAYRTSDDPRHWTGMARGTPITGAEFPLLVDGSVIRLPAMTSVTAVSDPQQGI